MGAYGCPGEAAASIALTTLVEFLKQNEAIKLVGFVMFDAETLNAYTKGLEKINLKQFRIKTCVIQGRASLLASRNKEQPYRLFAARREIGPPHTMVVKFSCIFKKERNCKKFFKPVLSHHLLADGLGCPVVLSGLVVAQILSEEVERQAVYHCSLAGYQRNSPAHSWAAVFESARCH